MTDSALPRSRSTETWRIDNAVAGPLIRAAHLGKRRTYQKGEYLYHQGETDTAKLLALMKDEKDIDVRIRTMK